MQLSSLLLLTGTARLALGAYQVADDYLSSDFFSNWDFFTGADPTDGYVTYVDQNTAQSNGYIKTNDDGSIYIGVDYTNTASGSGRNSVRISSQKAYTHYLTVIDLGHMPGGICGTWPAFWSFGNGNGGWPNEGEIDIIEGVNDQQTNDMTLHTSAGCSISSASSSLLQSVSQDCNAADNGNEGCSFHASNTNTYGSQFNSQGGGTYAAEWNSDGVSIWFWPSGGVPSDALGDSPDPSGWGMPTATWAGSSCDWDSHFQEHNLIFDITFCGDWAGDAFQSCSASNGGQTCQAFVQNNPSAFQDAYWQINALKVYQDNGAPASSSAPPAAASTSTPSAAPSSAPASTPSAAPTTESSSAAATSTTESSSAAATSTTPSAAPTTESSSAAATTPSSAPSSAAQSTTMSTATSKHRPHHHPSPSPSTDATTTEAAATTAAPVSSSAAAVTVQESSDGGIFLPSTTPSSTPVAPSSKVTPSASKKATPSSTKKVTPSATKKATPTAKPHTTPTPAPTPSSSTTASSVPSSSSGDLVYENSTGGVYAPGPTNAAEAATNPQSSQGDDCEDENGDGVVYRPAGSKRVNDFPEVAGLRKAQSAHLHRHIERHA